MKLSPAPKNTSIWSTSFGKGKYDAITINRVSNRRAARTIKNKELPERVVSACGFMQSFMKSGYTRLSSGVHGEVYAIDDVSKLRELYSTLHNRITHVPSTSIPEGTRVILKVIAVGQEDRESWDVSDERSLRRTFLTSMANRAVRNSLKLSPNKSLPRTPYRNAYMKIRANFDGQYNIKERGHHLRVFHSHQLGEIWKETLEEGARDATNHIHLMKSPAQIIHTPRGSIHLKASDVVPDFYFSGSSSQHGVYVIAMGVANGTTATKIKPMPPLLVANIEKAIVTLAVSGIEHGDLHSGNIMVAPDSSVTIIDFGMTSILPDTYRMRACKMIARAVGALFHLGTWPDDVANNFWYNPQNGIMRYMNSYMKNAHGKNFSWYNPSGKFLLYAKTRSVKEALDRCRVAVWSASIRNTKHMPRRNVVNYSNL